MGWSGRHHRRGLALSTMPDPVSGVLDRPRDGCCLAPSPPPCPCGRWTRRRPSPKRVTPPPETRLRLLRERRSRRRHEGSREGLWDVQESQSARCPAMFPDDFPTALLDTCRSRPTVPRCQMEDRTTTQIRSRRSPPGCAGCRRSPGPIGADPRIPDSVLLLARRQQAEPEVTAALLSALRSETSREYLRAIGAALAGVNPLKI